MTTTPWAHLPNAAHIDAVLAHLKQHPDKWGAAWDAAWDAARDAAWGAARGAAWDAARGAAWDAAWDAARGAARGAAWDALLALITWDDCAHHLLMPRGAVEVAARLGDHAAVLLMPAVIAMETT